MLITLRKKDHTHTKRLRQLRPLGTTSKQAKAHSGHKQGSKRAAYMYVWRLDKYYSKSAFETMYVCQQDPARANQAKAQHTRKRAQFIYGVNRYHIDYIRIRNTMYVCMYVDKKAQHERSEP